MDITRDVVALIVGVAVTLTIGPFFGLDKAPAWVSVLVGLGVAFVTALVVNELEIRAHVRARLRAERRLINRNAHLDRLGVK